MCWSIVSKAADDKTTLQALALINDSYQFKGDLSLNGSYYGCYKIRKLKDGLSK